MSDEATTAEVEDELEDAAIDDEDGDDEDGDDAGTDEADDDEFEDDYDEATAAERVLESCLRAIVDSPDDIDISVDERDRRLTLHVRVSGDDMGKIIGKRGRVANALRTLVKAAGSREGFNASVEIDD